MHLSHLLQYGGWYSTRASESSTTAVSDCTSHRRSTRASEPSTGSTSHRRTCSRRLNMGRADHAGAWRARGMRRVAGAGPTCEAAAAAAAPPRRRRFVSVCRSHRCAAPTGTARTRDRYGRVGRRAVQEELAHERVHGRLLCVEARVWGQRRNRIAGRVRGRGGRTLRILRTTEDYRGR